MTFAILLRAASEITGRSVAEIAGPARGHSLFRIRAAVCLLARRHTRMSLSWIGSRLGGRDHSSVHHAVRRAQEMRESDPDFRLMLSVIRCKALFG